jgi:hypothetical protein
MMIRFKGKYFLLLMFLILCALFPGYAYSAGTPTVVSGTNPAATLLGEVEFREFTSGVNEEIYLGVPDLDLGGAYRTDLHLTWNSPNAITFAYDPDLDKLTITVDNGSGNWILDYDQYSTNVRDLVYGGDQAAADDALSHLNYLQLNVTLRETSPAQLSLDNVRLDGQPLGHFSGVFRGTESWYVDGYDFSDGFQLTGDLNFNGITNPSPDKNTMEIMLGSIDVDEPEISSVLVAPNPALPGSPVTLTATAADSGTNNIQAAEYSIDGGTWNAMSPQDGTYDSPLEVVSAAVSAPTDQGVFSLCVRATNSINNTGQEQCTSLSVDDQGPQTMNLQLSPNPVISGGEVTLTATAADNGTNNIQSAEYNIDGGPWNPMDPQDGTYDSPAEVVTATFSAPADHGEFNFCVRATNSVSNTGQEQCTSLSVDGQGPQTINLQVSPNPVISGDGVTITATVDDSASGGLNISSGEYSLAAGPWNPLTAQDGNFDSPSEAVEATFDVLNQPGDYDLCVRGKDMLGNLGSAACTQLTVSADPDAPSGSHDSYLPVIINQSN